MKSHSLNQMMYFKSAHICASQSQGDPVPSDAEAGIFQKDFGDTIHGCWCPGSWLLAINSHSINKEQLAGSWLPSGRILVTHASWKWEMTEKYIFIFPQKYSGYNRLINPLQVPGKLQQPYPSPWSHRMLGLHDRCCSRVTSKHNS